jgi:hypothetical protein
VELSQSASPRSYPHGEPLPNCLSYHTGIADPATAPAYQGRSSQQHQQQLTVTSQCFCSTSLDDIVLEDLAALYRTVARHNAHVGTSVPQQGLTAHWQRLAGELWGRLHQNRRHINMTRLSRFQRPSSRSFTQKQLQAYCHPGCKHRATPS